MKIEIILVIALALVFIIDFFVRKKGKNSTIEIEKVLNTEIKRKSKIPIYVFSFSIAIALCIVIVDKQLYDKTLFKNDGFSFFDKLTSKRYNINDLYSEKIQNQWSKKHKFKFFYEIDVWKVKETMEVIDRGILYNSFGNIGLVKNGKLNGFYKRTFEKDSTTRITNIIDGVPQGKFTNYYKNGNIMEVKYYDKGYVVGDYKFYDSLGKKIIQEKYVKGYREGLRVFNGDILVDSAVWKNGSLNGIQKLHLVNGNTIKRIWSNGIMTATLKNNKVNVTPFLTAMRESKVSHTTIDFGPIQ